MHLFSNSLAQQSNSYKNTTAMAGYSIKLKLDQGTIQKYLIVEYLFEESLCLCSSV